MDITTIPTDLIDHNALPRDRSHLDPDALAELRHSILREGLRQPVEVWRLSSPRNGCEYGLIAGLRRLTAIRDLARLRGNGDFTTIPAFVRSPATLSDAMAAMVSENEVRAQITPWEKARLIITSVGEGLFATPDSAIAALFPASSAVTTSRLRALATLYCDLADLLQEPQLYSQRQLLRIAAAMRAGFGQEITVALQQAEKSAPLQWQILGPILTEAERAQSDPDCRPTAPTGRPRRLVPLRPGLMIRREWTPHGWRLNFTGPEATGAMLDMILDQVERDWGQ